MRPDRGIVEPDGLHRSYPGLLRQSPLYGDGLTTVVTTNGDDLRAVLRVSARADYAIRLVVAMAFRPGEVLSREYLAQSEQLPVKFVDHVLRQLRNAGLIESRRGRHGGYLLARTAETMSLADVVHAMAEPHPTEQLREGSAGWLTTVWSGLSDTVDAALSDITVGSLRDARRAEAAALDA